jgi:hypothetical protein
MSKLERHTKDVDIICDGAYDVYKDKPELDDHDKLILRVKLGALEGIEVHLKSDHRNEAGKDVRSDVLSAIDIIKSVLSGHYIGSSGGAFSSLSNAWGRPLGG